MLDYLSEIGDATSTIRLQKVGCKKFVQLQTAFTRPCHFSTGYLVDMILDTPRINSANEGKVEPSIKRMRSNYHVTRLAWYNLVWLFHILVLELMNRQMVVCQNSNMLHLQLMRSQ